MHKSLKKFLILSQVLGLSTLAATACTDNSKQTATTSTPSAPANDQTNKQSENDKQTNTTDTVNPKTPHTSIKTVGIKAGTGLAKGVLDTAIIGAAALAIQHSPKSAEKIEGVAGALVNTVNNGLDHKKEKLLEKEAVKQELKEKEKEAKKHEEAESGSHHGLLGKVADKLHLGKHGEGADSKAKP